MNGTGQRMEHEECHFDQCIKQQKRRHTNKLDCFWVDNIPVQEQVKCKENQGELGLQVEAFLFFKKTKKLDFENKVW